MCEACNKAFARQELYDEHVAQHVKCDQCAYSAAAKLVRLHQEQAHSAGSRALPPLESPEDIKRWIEERKRRWPTAENVLKRV